MNTRNKILQFFMSLAVLALFVFIYTIKLSPSARDAQKNEKNIMQVQLGMSELEVRSIMGEPKSQVQNYDAEYVVFYYQPRFGSSDGIYIHLSTGRKQVIRIIYPE